MLGSDSTDRVKELIDSYRTGNREAADQLFEVFYPQLRRIAAVRMKGERSEHSWQPTLLVNELYLQHIKSHALKPEDAAEGKEDRQTFLALAAWMMKRLLIHHSRPLSQKAAKVPVAEESVAVPSFESLAEMDQTLDRLEAIRPRLRQIVELRVFEGLTGDEIAERLGCGPATVTREWNFAKHWLQQELRPATKT